DDDEVTLLDPLEHLERDLSLLGTLAGDVVDPAGRGAGTALEGDRRGRLGGERRGGRRGAHVRHPLTGRCRSATTNCFWKIAKTVIVGSMMSSAPADRSTMSVPYWPWKAASAPATVRMSGSSIITRAMMNWFHVHRL